MFAVKVVDNRKREIHSDVQLDCPDKVCGSWLRVFGSVGELPSSTVCASEVPGEPASCQAKSIFSKYSSSCSSCRLPIHVGEVICCRRSDKNRIWVHAECFDEFALCKKCRTLISSSQNSIPSTCAAQMGFRHISCPAKE
jgi:hypothetical protein